MSKTPKIWEKELWYSKETFTDEMDDQGNYINGFTVPTQLFLNYQPVKVEQWTGYEGISTLQRYRAIVHIGTPEFELFNEDYDEGTLIYLNGASPTRKPKGYKGTHTKEPTNGSWANFEIESIKQSSLTKIIVFTRRKV